MHTADRSNPVISGRSATAVWRVIAVVALLAVAALLGNRFATGARLTAASSDTTTSTAAAHDADVSDDTVGGSDVTTPSTEVVDGTGAFGDAAYEDRTGGGSSFDAGFDAAGPGVGSADDSSSGWSSDGRDDAVETTTTDDGTSGVSSTGQEPEADAAPSPAGSDAATDDAPASTEPSVTPGTATAANQPPTLPARPDLVVHVPVGVWTTIVSDRSLSAGWRDADSTADWLCLDFQPEDKQSWGLDGADCTGQGLRAFAPQAGTYVVHVQAKEATSANPAGGAPYSSTVNTILIVAG